MAAEVTSKIHVEAALEEYCVPFLDPDDDYVKDLLVPIHKVEVDYKGRVLKLADGQHYRIGLIPLTTEEAAFRSRVYRILYEVNTRSMIVMKFPRHFTKAETDACMQRNEQKDAQRIAKLNEFYADLIPNADTHEKRCKVHDEAVKFRDEYMRG